MRKMSVLVVMAMLLSVLLAACGGGGAKGTVEDMIKAMEKRNADDLGKTLCSDADVELSGLAEMFDEIDKIEFDDMKYEEVESSDDSATIRVTGSMRMEMELEGETMSEENSFDTNFMLVKQDGDWCIVTSTDN